jgi:hypothetical protein
LSKATQRTLEALKKQGALCDMVERFIQHAGPIQFSMVAGKRIGKRTGIRKDLFGIIDIIALFPDREKICGVQSCGTSFSEHMKKILASSYAPIWLRYGDLELWGWRKLKAGWTPKIHKFTLIDFL